MGFYVTIFGVTRILFPFIFFCVALSDFRYHYLLTSLYVFAILIVIVENNLENKIIHVFEAIKYFMYKFLSILPSNYLKILSYTIC
jgi:hypothetical protein